MAGPALRTAHGPYRAATSSSVDVATARVPVICSLSIILVLYLAAFDADADFQWASFAVFGLLAVVALRTASHTRDALNPLSVLIALCLVRIAFPAIVLPHLDTPRGTVINDFDITAAEFVRGQHLATVGLLAVVIGWYASPASWALVVCRGHRFANRHLTSDRRIAASAVFFFGCGIVAALVYLALNFGDPVAAFLSGVARGDSSPGTSRYGFLAVGFLITSGVILSLHAATRPKASWARIFAPALLAAALLTRSADVLSRSPL